MANSIYPPYPPELSEERLSFLITNVRDWQLTHGILVKQSPPNAVEADALPILSRPIGVTLFPSLFPERCFEEARSLQNIYNELYAAITEDEDWLFEVLREYSV